MLAKYSLAPFVDPSLPMVLMKPLKRCLIFNKSKEGRKWTQSMLSTYFFLGRGVSQSYPNAFSSIPLMKSIMGCSCLGLKEEALFFFSSAVASLKSFTGSNNVQKIMTTRSLKNSRRIWKEGGHKQEFKVPRTERLKKCRNY